VGIEEVDAAAGRRGGGRGPPEARGQGPQALRQRGVHTEGVRRHVCRKGSGFQAVAGGGYLSELRLDRHSYKGMQRWHGAVAFARIWLHVRHWVLYIIPRFPCGDGYFLTAWVQLGGMGPGNEVRKKEVRTPPSRWTDTVGLVGWLLPESQHEWGRGTRFGAPIEQEVCP